MKCTFVKDFKISSNSCGKYYILNLKIISHPPPPPLLLLALLFLYLPFSFTSSTV
jgi:hypothetical protein